jgi:hypothetical protein
LKTASTIRTIGDQMVTCQEGLLLVALEGGRRDR